jgi:hypothetical protein
MENVDCPHFSHRHPKKTLISDDLPALAAINSRRLERFDKSDDFGDTRLQIIFASSSRGARNRPGQHTGNASGVSRQPPFVLESADDKYWQVP